MSKKLGEKSESRKNKKSIKKKKGTVYPWDNSIYGTGNPCGGDGDE